MNKSQRFSDHAVALMALQDGGSTREEALEILALHPESVSAELVANKRAALDAEFERAAEEAFAASPEGRARAGREARLAAEARAERAGDQRALLASEGYSIDGLTDDEILHVSGVDRQVSMMSRAEKDSEVERLALSPEWGRLSNTEKALRASEFGTTSASIESFREFSGIASAAGESGEGGGSE